MGEYLSESDGSDIQGEPELKFTSSIRKMTLNRELKWDRCVLFTTELMNFLSLADALEK